MSEEIRGVMAIKIVTAEELLRATIENVISAKTILGFYKSVKTLGISGQAEWAKKDWSVFTVTNGNKITQAEALEAGMEYVILARVFIMTEHAVIQANPVSYDAEEFFKDIFSCEDIEEFKRENPGNWKFPLFDFGCHC